MAESCQDAGPSASEVINATLHTRIDDLLALLRANHSQCVGAWQSPRFGVDCGLFGLSFSHPMFWAMTLAWSCSDRCAPLGPAAHPGTCGLFGGRSAFYIYIFFPFYRYATRDSVVALGSALEDATDELDTATARLDSEDATCRATVAEQQRQLTLANAQRQALSARLTEVEGPSLSGAHTTTVAVLCAGCAWVCPDRALLLLLIALKAWRFRADMPFSPAVFRLQASPPR